MKITNLHYTFIDNYKPYMGFKHCPVIDLYVSTLFAFIILDTTTLWCLFSFQISYLPYFSPYPPLMINPSCSINETEVIQWGLFIFLTSDIPVYLYLYHYSSYRDSLLSVHIRPITQLDSGYHSSSPFQRFCTSMYSVYFAPSMDRSISSVNTKNLQKLFISLIMPLLCLPPQ